MRLFDDLQQFGPMTPQPTAYNPTEPGQYPSQMRPSSNMVLQGSQPVTYNNGAPPPYGGTPGHFPNQINRNSQPQAMPSQIPYQVELTLTVLLLVAN